MPKCIECGTKQARIGKKFGYAADLLCSQKCAVDFVMSRVMDYELCEVCGQWVIVCGGCSEEQSRRIELGLKKKAED